MSTTRRGLILMTTSSLAVPIAGVVSQPILARALGIEGRGELAAALAPAALVLALATLGLPEALTYYVARRPSITRVATFGAIGITVAVGLCCFALALLLLPVLSSGDAELGRLVLIGILVTVPALSIGVLRGAAVGLQMWTAVALEKVATVGFRILSLLILWWTGSLDVLAALLITTAAPLIALATYARILVRPRGSRRGAEAVFVPLVSFGSRIWVGSVTEILLGRIAAVMIAPLSGIEDLALYSVAVAIADVPLIVALAAQSALYGVNSRSQDIESLARAARLVLLLAVVGCSVLALSVPLWLVPLFGAEFTRAALPTVLLLLSAVVCVPGLMAAVTLSARNRPGLRSTVLMVTLGSNVLLLLALVPPFGVYGACMTSVASNVVMTSTMLAVARRVLGVPASSYLRIGGAEVRTLFAECSAIVRRARRT